MRAPPVIPGALGEAGRQARELRLSWSSVSVRRPRGALDERDFIVMAPKIVEIPVLTAALEWLPLDPMLLLALTTLAGLYLAIGVIALQLPRRGESPPEWLGPFVEPAVAVAVDARKAVAVVFLLAFCSGLANGLVRYPAPSVNDEFGYLLAADTFAQGRLANPTHPLWIHFETIGASHEPSYVTKYPPGTSLFLAFGQTVFGHPWWGQLFAYALAAAAVAWMLRAWVGPRWGMIGGVLVALHPNLQHFDHYDYGWANYSWSHSYWGGAVAMLGAALIFGGLRNFLRRPRATYGLAMGIGAALLANSRPMEGLLACLPVAVLLLVRVHQGRIAIPTLASRLVAPAALVMLPVAAFMIAANVAATGDPLRLSHQHYGAQYGAAAELLFQEARTPPDSYGNLEMERFYLEWVRPTFLERQSSWDAYWASRVRGLEKFAWFFCSTTWPALLVLPLLLRKRWWWFALGIVGVSLFLLMATFDFHPHYAAPAVPLLFAIVTAGLAQMMRLGGHDSMLGRTLILGIIGLTACWRMWSMPADQQNEITATNDWPRTRAFVLEQLEARPGKDLVLVSTAPDHLMFQNWVHNGADLEAGGVVFARDLGLPLENHPVIQYYPDRQLWHLQLSVDTWSFRSVERTELVAGS